MTQETEIRAIENTLGGRPELLEHSPLAALKRMNHKVRGDHHFLTGDDFDIIAEHLTRYGRALDKLTALLAENKELRAVVEAAREISKNAMAEPFLSDMPTRAVIPIEILKELRAALANLPKGGEHG